MSHVEELDSLLTATGLSTLPGKLLYSGLSALKPGQIYLLGYNPGGEPDHEPAPILSHLRSQDAVSRNEYLDAAWATRTYSYPPGAAPLQRRVRHLLHELGLDVRSVCASNLIFVRSKSGAHLPEGVQLAERCWPIHSYILGIVRPACILCFDKKVWDFVARKGIMITTPEAKPAGHANWACLSALLRLDERELGLIAVPHLSRYAIDQHPGVLDWIRSKLSIPPTATGQREASVVAGHARATSPDRSTVRRLQDSRNSRSAGYTGDNGVEIGNIDPQQTIILLDRLVAMGLSNEAFRTLHHSRDTINGFRQWCLKKSRFASGGNNERVHMRLAHVLKEFTGRQLPAGQRQIFMELAREAMKRIPALP